MKKIVINYFQYGHYYAGNSWRSGADSAGAVSVRGDIINTTARTMKSITLYFLPYNSIGEILNCAVKHRAECGLVLNGSYEPNHWYSFYGKDLWYNAAITSIIVSKVKIVYLDGTEETLTGSEIDVSSEGAYGDYVPRNPDGTRPACYVATAVYGSYDCPQVWTLRRYRDNMLARTWYGRAFIHTYYAISPTLVKWFGKTEWFKNMWKPKLDRMVEKLRANGVSDTPYEDKNW